VCRGCYKGVNGVMSLWKSVSSTGGDDEVLDLRLAIIKLAETDGHSSFHLPAPPGYLCRNASGACHAM
jgi:hypothetical protein